MSAKQIIIKNKISPQQLYTERKNNPNSKFLQNCESKKPYKLSKEKYFQLPGSQSCLNYKKNLTNISHVIFQKQNGTKFQKQNGIKFQKQNQTEQTYHQKVINQILSHKRFIHKKSKKPADFIQQVLKSSDRNSKTSKEKFPQIKKKSSSVLDSKKRMKSKQKSNNPPKLRYLLKDQRKPFVSLHVALLNEKNQSEKQEKSSRNKTNRNQILNQIQKRNDRSQAHKKNQILINKFVINPFEGLRVKNNKGKNDKNDVKVETNQNNKYFCIQPILSQLNQISTIGEVSLDLESPLGNESIEMLQLLKMCIK